MPFYSYLKHADGDDSTRRDKNLRVAGNLQRLKGAMG